MPKKITANEIRQQFIDFFKDKYDHTVVPSSSLVPGDDATLLFTNSGMVQFKDVFLGTDKRNYVRAVDSQKCLRVAGKHNDLEDVGFNDTHHTFFEMLGNWSFGDYYKKEAIAWAWELLTEVWGLPKDMLYATVFKDEKGGIPTDDEAVEHWKNQPGIDLDHILYLGRSDNFWEMADTGPCGPNSEIILDRGEKFGELTYLENGDVDLDGPRFLELWNLVFIQYNRTDPTTLEPLPATHVDTGLGLERIVSVLQDQSSNYRTDLFWPLIQRIQELTGHSNEEREEHFTPYRVIADHVRAATFLISDGVIPGNMNRNYITRMVIRRAARFGSKIGLNEPFLAKVAEVLIEDYGDFYPDLVKNRETIMDNLTREEEQFQKTVENGIGHLENILTEMEEKGQKILPGKQAFDLYGTHGLPMEITRDIAQEQGLDVDEDGFHKAIKEHRLASGGGKAIGELGGEDVKIFNTIFEDLQKNKKLTKQGVEYNPYETLEMKGEILALVQDGKNVKDAKKGDKIEVIIPTTSFYIASGGQIDDMGTIADTNGKWEIKISAMRRPAAGIISHVGTVTKGSPKVGNKTISKVDATRRQDIKRNHTATHLLHNALHNTLGDHARQAGSLVAPDRLRFDFNHPQAVTKAEIDQIEMEVNNRVLENHTLKIEIKTLDEAKKDGAMALFGEKYGEEVRTIQIGDDQTFSYELCGGTHVNTTNEISTFIITSEGSAAAGIRRIEAITGREALNYINQQRNLLTSIATTFDTPVDNLNEKTITVLETLNQTQKELASLKSGNSSIEFDKALTDAPKIKGVTVLAINLFGADRDTLRNMADRFRQKTKSGMAVLATVIDKKPALIATLTDDLVKKGLKAGDLVNVVAEPLGGKGGGRPNLAQAGGKDASKLDEALNQVGDWAKNNL